MYKVWDTIKGITISIWKEYTKKYYQVNIKFYDKIEKFFIYNYYLDFSKSNKILLTKIDY